MKGGGKEEQGPRSKLKKKEMRKETANVAEGDEDSVWMAIADVSDDEDMANDEFNDFIIHSSS